MSTYPKPTTRPAPPLAVLPRDDEWPAVLLVNEAEDGLISSLLIEPSALERIAGRLKASHFHQEARAWTFKAIQDVAEEGLRPDPITVGTLLEQQGRLADVGGYADLISLASQAGSGASVEAYAEIILRAAKRRRTLTGVSRIAELANDPRIDPGQLPGYLSQLAENLAQDSLKARFTPIRATEYAPPDPIWLAEGVFQQDSLAAVVGQRESLKSFLVGELLAAVATGRPFAGCPVERGLAVYVVGESAPGIKRRLKAWQIARGMTLENLYVVDQPPQLGNRADVAEFISRLKSLPERPRVICLDTWARHTVGLDENSARDAGLAVDSLEKIRAETGALVVVVHHEGRATNGKAKGQPRGSSAFDAAMATIITVERDSANDVITVRCSKQKDGPHFAAFAMKPRVVELGNGQTSLVLDRSEGPVLTQTQQDMIAVLQELRSATSGEWEEACQVRKGIAHTRFTEQLKPLLDYGQVFCKQEGRTKRYQVRVPVG